MSDPFEILADDELPVRPRPEFAEQLRKQLSVLLNTPTFDVPTRDVGEIPASSRFATPKSAPTGSTPRRPAMPTHRVTPYLTVNDGDSALSFYATAFGAVETMRVVMNEDTGQLGHAEFHIGDAVFFLSDEFAEMGVLSPATLGGTAVALYIEVDDVDATLLQRSPAAPPRSTNQLISPTGHAEAP